MVKNPPAMRVTWVRSLSWEDPLEEGMVTHSSILAGKFHGQRSLEGYSHWSHKEMDMTKATQHICMSIFKYYAYVILKNKMLNEKRPSGIVNFKLIITRQTFLVY